MRNSYSALLTLYCASLIVLLTILPIQTPLFVFLQNRAGIWLGFALWKEALVSVLTFINFVIILKNFRLLSLQRKMVLFLSSGLILWSVVTSFFINKLPESSVFLIGFRFELFWLVYAISSFLSLPIIFTSFIDRSLFLKSIKFSVLAGFAFSAVFTLITIILGTQKTLSWMGYSNQNINTTPQICHVVDAGSDICRLSGGFSTPNHFAAYLLLILGYCVFIFKNEKSWLFFVGAIVSSLLIVFSYARFAWLGLLLISFWLLLPNRNSDTQVFKKATKITKILAGVSLLVPIFIGIVAINLPEEVLQTLPPSLAKPSSTFWHSMRTRATIDVLTSNPDKFVTGFGIGSAGPAAKIEYYDITKNSLFINNQQIAYNYRLVGEDLAIPENWYLQLVMNGGIFYALIYTLLLGFGLRPIIKYFKTGYSYSLFIAIGLFCIMIGNLFLHIWENQTVAIYFAVFFAIQQIIDTTDQAHKATNPI